jgi:plasmid stabilization system protein ParE
VSDSFLLSPSGRLDLDEIWHYIAQDNRAAANRVEQELIAAMRLLADRPLLGHSRQDLTSKNVRFWSVYSYLIIYDPATTPLHILRIISGYRDIKRQLESQ